MGVQIHAKRSEIGGWVYRIWCGTGDEYLTGELDEHDLSAELLRRDIAKVKRHHAMLFSFEVTRAQEEVRKCWGLTGVEEDVDEGGSDGSE